MKKIITLLSCFSLCLSLLACGGTKQIQQTSLQIPETKDIIKLQIHSIQVDMDEYPASQLESLVYNLKKVKPMDQEEAAQIKRGEDYIPISFFYNDGTKDIFYFFQFDSNWYVETGNGELYKNADFITKFANLPQKAETTTALEMSPELLRMRLELETEFESLGLDFAFVYYVKFFMENVDPSEAEAVSYTRKLLTDNMKLYQSAKLLGITVSDEELEKQIQDYIIDIPQADNFNKEYKKIYEEAGISLEESAVKNKEFMRFATMRHMLYRHIRDEFADGKDTIDGHVYENTEDYYYAYLEHIAYPQIEESVIKDFTEQLDQAEKLYYEKYGKSS